MFIFEINLPELPQLLLTKIEDEAVYTLLKQLRDLDLVTEALQDELATLAEACVLFSGVILRFPSSADRPGTKAAIIKNQAFE